MSRVMVELRLFYFLPRRHEEHEGDRLGREKSPQKNTCVFV